MPERRLSYPLDKIHVTQRFGGWPEHYKRYGLKGHNGIDYRVRFADSPMGRRYVSAAEGGTVEVVRADVKGYGTHIRLRHSDGALTIYAHLTRSYVSKGDVVRRGQIIGLSGNTGDSTASHLHFEFRPAGVRSTNGFAGAVDPEPYFIPEPVKQFWG